MKLKLAETEWSRGRDGRAILMIDDDLNKLIMMQMPGAKAIAKQIAIAVNFHEKMVAVLTIFGSKDGMGKLLVDAITADVCEKHLPSIISGRMRKLINAVDIILKGIELTKGDDDAHQG